MNPSAPPPKPVFNDALYQALSPLQGQLTQQQRVEAVMKKYGRQIPKDQPKAPATQWVGDDHA